MRRTSSDDTFGPSTSGGLCACGAVSPFIAASDIYDFANSAIQYVPGSNSWGGVPIPLPMEAPSTTSGSIVATHGQLFFVGDGTSPGGVAATVWAPQP